MHRLLYALFDAIRRRCAKPKQAHPAFLYIRARRKELSATSTVVPSCRATASHRGMKPKRAGSARHTMDANASARFCKNCTVLAYYLTLPLFEYPIALGKEA